MPFDGFADCIGTGEDLSLLMPDGHMATDPFELPDHYFRLDPGSKGQRDQATDRFGLGGSTPPCLSYLVKDLEEISFLIFVYGNIQVSTTCPDLPGGAMDHLLTILGPSLRLRDHLPVLQSFLSRRNYAF